MQRTTAILLLTGSISLLTLLGCGSETNSKGEASTTYVSVTASGAINLANRSAYALEGICQGPEQVLTVVLEDIQGQKVEAAPICDGDGKWSVDVMASYLNDGEVAIVVSYEESEGGIVRSAKIAVTKDVRPPTVGLATDDDIALDGAGAYSLSGTCSEPGQVVGVRLSDSSLAQGVVTPSVLVTCTQQKTWKTTLNPSGLADGIVNIEVDMKDRAGNPSELIADEIIKDTQAPDLKLIGHNNILSGGASYGIWGYCSEGGRDVAIKLTDSAATPVVINTKVVCRESDYIWALNNHDVQSLSDGAVTIEVSQSDRHGNSNTRAVTVEKSASTIGVSIGQIPIINAGNQGDYPLTGSCIPDGYSVTVTVAGVAPTTAATCASGGWEARFNLAGQDDGDSLPIVAEYSDGTTSAPTARSTALKDTTPPLVSVATSDSISIATAGSYTMRGRCEGAREVAIELTDGTNRVSPATQPLCSAVAANEWITEVDTAALADGQITATATQSDLAANTGSDSRSDIVRDTRVPTLQITNAPNILAGDGDFSSYVLGGSCSDDGGSIALLLVDLLGLEITPARITCESGNWQTRVDVTTLAEGLITITAIHTDATGNPSSEERAIPVKDTDAPLLAITSTGNILTAGAYTVSGECGETGKPVQVELRDRDTPVNNALPTSLPDCDANNMWTADIAIEDLRDGYIDVIAALMDSAGNKTTARMVVIKDLVELNLTLDTPANILAGTVDSYQLDGTCTEPGHGVEVALADSAQALTATGVCGGEQEGRWSVAIAATALLDETITITATHSDLLGNSISLSPAPTVAKDVVVPEITITSYANINMASPASKESYPLEGTCDSEDREITIAVSDSASRQAPTPPGITCSAGVWSGLVDISSLQDGQIAIAVSYTDPAGNIGDDSETVQQDTQKPVVTASSPNNIFPDTKSSYQVSGTCSEIEGLVTIEFHEDVRHSRKYSEYHRPLCRQWGVDTHGI